MRFLKYIFFTKKISCELESFIKIIYDTFIYLITHREIIDYKYKMYLIAFVDEYQSIQSLSDKNIKFSTILIEDINKKILMSRI